MKNLRKFLHFGVKWVLPASLFLAVLGFQSADADLSEVRERGVLRHLGVPYANFVTGSGDGFDVELIRLFAEHLNVKYEFVKSSWENLFGDLTGHRIQRLGKDTQMVSDAPINGDLAACGITVLPWREELASFSSPTFPTQVWLIARAESPIRPIRPTGDIEKDIGEVKTVMRDRLLLAKLDTCLDPSLHGLWETGANVKCFKRSLNEMAPAVINGEAEMTLLDVPDALVALEKWPGKLKVIGPISREQTMACAFSKDSTRLRETFDDFLDELKKDGRYLRLVNKYYPNILLHFPAFFNKGRTD
jgi:ABC-type amino acid transport substrate-binding protein